MPGHRNQNEILQNKEKATTATKGHLKGNTSHRAGYLRIDSNALIVLGSTQLWPSYTPAYACTKLCFQVCKVCHKFY